MAVRLSPVIGSTHPVGVAPVCALGRLMTACVDRDPLTGYSGPTAQLEEAERCRDLSVSRPRPAEGPYRGLLPFTSLSVYPPASFPGFCFAIALRFDFSCIRHTEEQH